MNVLDMLQARLMAQQEEGQGSDDILPEVVRRSIFEQPSYVEGQWIPRAPNPALAQERATQPYLRRESDLSQAMGQSRAV